MPLRNLNELATAARAKFDQHDFSSEIELPDRFKNLFVQILAGNQVNFLRHTFFIVKSDGLRIYGPNQWFVLGIYLVDYLKELKLYKEKFPSIFSSYAPRGTAKELKPIYESLRNSGSPERIKAEYISAIDNYFTLESDRANYKKFVTDYEWWFGSKGLERGDYAYSPLLSIPKLVNDTHSFVGGIALTYASHPELLDIITSIVEEGAANSQDTVDAETRETPAYVPYPHNWIVYGAPGTGKSHYLDTKANESFDNDSRLRVTFYPDYSYSKFVGAYKPVPVYKSVSEVDETKYYDFQNREHSGDSRREPLIDYRFVAGPFLVQLVKALKNPETPILLQIEEINRANAAAVFGEVFQLLDRNTDGSSTYSVGLSKEAMKYVQEEVDGFNGDTINIPSNFYIWATMNSADQGVLPLDSAFKRRWTFKYLPLNHNGSIISSWRFSIAGIDFNWSKLREIINMKLSSERVSEDKLLGPFFITQSTLSDADAIVSNLLLYLREDVVRHKPSVLFNEVDGSYNLSRLVQQFTASPLSLFNFSIQEAVVKPAIEEQSDVESDNPHNPEINDGIMDGSIQG